MVEPLLTLVAWLSNTERHRLEDPLLVLKPQRSLVTCHDFADRCRVPRDRGHVQRRAQTGKTAATSLVCARPTG
jgi:hypothetical protein